MNLTELHDFHFQIYHSIDLLFLHFLLSLNYLRHLTIVMKLILLKNLPLYLKYRHYHHLNHKHYLYHLHLGHSLLGCLLLLHRYMDHSLLKLLNEPRVYSYYSLDLLLHSTHSRLSLIFHLSLMCLFLFLNIMMYRIMNYLHYLGLLNTTDTLFYHFHCLVYRMLDFLNCTM